MSPGATLLIGLATAAAAALILWLMGRPALCDCRAVKIWHGSVTGVGNSQHLLDWYSGMHVVAGMLFFGVMWLTSRHWPKGPLIIAAVVAGAGWELVENTPFMIERYGQSAAGAFYNGDSVPNALSDVVFTLVGFAAAMLIPGSWTAAAALAVEVGLALAVRDSLVIGAIILIDPAGAIAAWQASG